MVTVLMLALDPDVWQYLHERARAGGRLNYSGEEKK